MKLAAIGAVALAFVSTVVVAQDHAYQVKAREIYAQWRANRHRCIPRNTALAIAADGTYQYCFNDIRHSHALGHVDDMSIREALALREGEDADPNLCDGCNVRRRYGAAEVARAALSYLRA